MGRIEVFDRRSNQWGTICNNDVSSGYELAHMICKSLGYYDYRNYRLTTADNSSIGLSSNNPNINGSFYCTYASSFAYQNLYQCLDFESHLGASPSRCTSDEEWILFCTRKLLI